MAVTAFADITNYDKTRFEKDRVMAGAANDEGWMLRQTGIADNNELKASLLDLREYRDFGFYMMVAITNLDTAAHTTTGYDVYVGHLRKGTAITGITNDNPGVATATAHGLSDDDYVLISGVAGMTELNGNIYVVDNKAANTFQFDDAFGNNTNTTSYGTYTSGGTVQKIVQTSCKNAITWITNTDPAALATGTQAIGLWNQPGLPDFFRVSVTGNASESDVEVCVRLIRILPTTAGALRGI